MNKQAITTSGGEGGGVEGRGALHDPSSIALTHQGLFSSDTAECPPC